MAATKYAMLFASNEQLSKFLFNKNSSQLSDSKDKELLDKYVKFVESLKKKVNSQKMIQTQHRLTIQSELVEKLDNASDEKNKKAAIRSYERNYENDSVKNSYETLIQSFAGIMTLSSAKETYRSILFDNVSATELSISFFKWGQKAEEERKIPVALIFLGDNRFKKITIPNTVNQVFEHRQTKKHFVQDKNNVFVRRYQTRSISADDLEDLKSGRGIQSKRNPNATVTAKELGNYGTELDLKQNDKLEEWQKVFFQLQRGDQRYLSLTSTKHKIFGNGGECFTQYGLISVDLAMLPKEKIVDVHSPGAIMSILSVTREDFLQAFDSTVNQPSDKQKAVRDTVRTREVLVEGSIPFGAIKGFGKDMEGEEDYSAPPCFLDNTDRVDASSVWK